VSLTILEAMAAGLPVVATPVGGNPEVVIDQETGLIVPARARSLAEAVVGLAADALKRRVFGLAGRWRVNKHFSVQRMVSQYADTYLGRRHAIASAPISAPVAAETISVSEATRSMV